MDREFRIADRVFSTRLFMGSARFPDTETLIEAILASEASMVTISMRRISMQNSHTERFIERLQGLPLLPNTAGCMTAKEAVLTAELSREALRTNWIKLEVIGDRKTLYPDVSELLKAAHECIRAGFIVLPYCNDDPITCKKLADMGCAAVMPLASPIGSGMGLLNSYNLQIIREEIDIPIIVDAGIGTASDAVKALELGVDGVLIDSAIACAEHPVAMARAMKHACQAGRLAYLAGRIPRKFYAAASSPLEGVIGK